MRIVILSSSPYSETGCAMAVRMARLGHTPVGALVLSPIDRATLLRKMGQWGVRGVVRYASKKLAGNHGTQRVNNPYLESLLTDNDKDKDKDKIFRNTHEVAAHYRFPVAVCSNQNDSNAIAQLRAWSPDLLIFTGGNILRKPLLDVPRQGVLNAHLGLLPEIRGMSTVEWSLLNRVPVGVTIHYMDAGIDTGPILMRSEFPDTAQCESLDDLRHRLIAFGIEKAGEVVVGLDRGAIHPTPQSDLERDHQFFVMHERLRTKAVEQLSHYRLAVVGEHE
jgi:folate-dependent phosphoribosylglycinamide formyltransferase PurN